MIKVLEDLMRVGLGKVSTITIPGNQVQVHYFHKTPVPTEMEKMPECMQLLAKCGINLGAYTTAIESKDEERDRHTEDYKRRQCTHPSSPSPKKRKVQHN